jgi:APA family basic amino acid/polyamine antiporter
MSTTTTPTDTPAPQAGGEPGFKPKLGLFDAVMLIVGTMIGSGIFVVSAEIARDVGSSGWFMGVWILTALMTLMGALAYAELARVMPHAGGQYIFLRDAYSPMWGFLYGWTCFLVIQTGSIAAVAVVFAKYLGVLIPGNKFGTDVTRHCVFGPWDVNIKLTLPGMEQPFFEMAQFGITNGQLVAVGVIIVLTWLNCRGVREGSFVQNLFTVTKVAALIALIIVGLTLALSVDVWNANWAEPWGGIAETPRANEVQKIVEKSSWFGWLAENQMVLAFMVAGGAMVGALFAADAWNNVTFIGNEIKEPRKNLPRSLILGVGFVMLLYLLANLGYLASLPINGNRQVEGRLTGLASSAKAAEARKKTALEILQDENATPEKKARAEETLKELEEQAKAAEKTRKETLDAAGPAGRGIANADEDRVATAVVEIVSPTYGAYLMAIAIMISTFGCVNGMTLMGAWLYYAMARDGLFFQAVGGLNKKAVPAVGLVLQGIWSALLVFSGTYNDLLDFVIFAVLVFYVLTVTGMFILCWKMPKGERPNKGFGFPIVPAIYVLLCLVICVNLLVVKPKYTWPGLIIVVSGIPVYVLWRIFGKKPDKTTEPAA